MADSHKILIIEDNQNILLAERICLEAAGYTVLAASDGICGLEQTVKHQPDLIILDLLIPKMDGYLVLEALRNDPALSRIPVLVASAKAQADDVRQAMTQSVRGYLVKPFTPQELLVKVNEAIKSKKGDKDG